MAASSAADIPESKSDYCPCNRCTVARKQGRQETIERVRKLHHPFKPCTCDYDCDVEVECDVCGEYYPCETIKILDGIK